MWYTGISSQVWCAEKRNDFYFAELSDTIPNET